MRNRSGCGLYVVGGILAALFLSVLLIFFIDYTANAAAPTLPVVSITNVDPDGTVNVNESVIVFAQARDLDGIAKAELWVNGQLVATQVNARSGEIRPFNVSQAWVPTGSGNYLVLVRAIDGKGFAGQSEPLMVQVGERSNVPDPNAHGEYIVGPEDTLEDIAAIDPGIESLPAPGTSIDLPPEIAEGAGSDDDAPPGDGEEDAPRVDPPVPAPPAPGDAEPAEPFSPFGAGLIPGTWICLFSPSICASPTGGEAAPPIAPSAVGADSGVGCQLSITWQDNSVDETGFKIFRVIQRPRFQFQLLEIVSSNPGSGAMLGYVDVSPPNGSMFYVVAAFNGSGEGWSAPSEERTISCVTPEAGEGFALAVEGLSMTVRDSYDRLYCYASIAESPFERIPHGASRFIELESGSWNIAEHFSGSNKRTVIVHDLSPLSISAECLGWQGGVLVNLGRFIASHPSEEWDGRPLTTASADGSYSVTYRIMHTMASYDETGSSSWPLIDGRAPSPYNLRATDSWSECSSVAPDLIICGLVEEPGLAWDYTPFEGAPRLPLFYRVFVRQDGDLLPRVHYTTGGSRSLSAPQITDCNAHVHYSVSALLGYDELTGEEILSPPSEELEIFPSCAELEITLVSLWVYGVLDGDPCTIFISCANDYEAYGWFAFNESLIRWNDHCDPGFLEGCVTAGPSYSVVTQASRYSFADRSLNTGDGYRRSNNVIRIPIHDGEPLQFVFRLRDHDGSSGDDFWCGMRTGRGEIALEGRSVEEWLRVDQDVDFDTNVISGHGECIITYHVRGVTP